ncbi:MBL fold metallo-hydrolase [Sphingomonas sp. BN140010]|uniref:MBL fold metallo-hydrolase n=1 Tax=Sphingomonas arvum TaxID=2992113 RepID=A0ABT3JBZ0_9SPHN|nr:MBL fold metallo-hydrolase [Sphingomonas sp. BN140010]MCW3796572.1 MBL fold metallo-hydrolase [Sphingomonas sp. BN140010]
MAANPYYSGPPSDHFDGTRFFNPDQPTTDRGLLQVLRWKVTERAADWPESVSVVPARPAARVDRLTVTMVGHATLLIQAPGVNLLTDPVWSERASPLTIAGPKRVTAPGVAFEDLPPIDVVLLSHNHYDHLDTATLQRLQAVHDPLIVMPLGNDAIVGKAVNKARMVVGDWGDRIGLGGGGATTLTRANHWSARGTRDRRMALWCGHWIKTAAGSVWFAGDTGYGSGTIFPEIRARHGAPDVALVPIGAYAPRWFMAAQHADPGEAVRIMRDVGAARALGIHWGTFQLTDEARDEPAERLRAAVAEAGIAADRFVAAEPGGVYRF